MASCRSCKASVIVESNLCLMFLHFCCRVRSALALSRTRREGRSRLQRLIRTKGRRVVALSHASLDVNGKIAAGLVQTYQPVVSPYFKGRLIF